MKTLQIKMNLLLKGYRINRKYLKKKIESYYPDGSKMGYYITTGSKKSRRPIPDDIRQKLWEEHGIPHVIFDDLDKWISSKVAEEGILDED